MPTPATNVEMMEVIARSGLLPPATVAEYAAAFGRTAPDAGPRTLLTRLIEDGVITPFQAGFLAAGRYKGFFLGGKYKLLDHLGSGGMGEVYLGEQLPLHRLVAVKILKGAKDTSDPNGAVQRFFREARAAAALKHPNIAQLFDVDSTGPNPFMVMEYVDGTNMHAVVAEHGRLSVPRAVNYTVQAARGLAHAHQSGLVHRDVKPGNLMIDRTGAVKVLDLGLARYLTDAAKNANLTAEYDDNTLIGTADFIAPEQTQDSSAVDHRADVYSLGCTLYFFLAGRSPFEEGTVAQKLLWHQLKPPPPVAAGRPDLPAGLVAVLDTMMAKERERRYQTADEVAAALAPWFDPSLPPPPRKEMPRVRADQYRLGLVDAPPPPETVVRPPETLAAGPRSGSVVNVAAPPPADNPDWVSAGSRSPRTVRRRRTVRRTIFFAAVQLALLAVTAAVTLYLYRWANPANDPARASLPTRFPPVELRPDPLPAGGSSLVDALMQEWAADYAAGGKRGVAYQSSRSSEGVERLLKGELRLACTDVPVAATEVTKAAADGRELVQVPITLSAVVPVYNLKGVKNKLHLDGPTLAAIYLGEVTRWNDRRIYALNEKEDVKLPDTPITRVYRPGGSGTTAIFTDFLAKSSSEWAAKYPSGTKLEDLPPEGKADTNQRLVQKVAEIDGAIGYVELATARVSDVKEALVRNAAGSYPEPTPLAVQTAAAESLPPTLEAYSIVYPTGPTARGAYPIAGYTWAVFDAKAPPGDLADLLEFLLWTTRHGPGWDADKGKHYAPLPPKVAERVESELRGLASRLQKP